MPIDYESLMATNVTDVPVNYSDRDSMLYALALGFGSDPSDRRELAYVIDAPMPKTVPTMASVLMPGGFLADCGWDYGQVLRAGESLELYRPLPTAADLLANRRVTAVYDRGVGVGAEIVVRSDVRMAKDDAALFTLDSALIARADGGFGAAAVSAPEPHAMPAREPDLRCEIRTRPDQALLFRLTGDRNPLYTDSAAAREAGFETPLLHGRCIYGIACRAILRTICEYDHTLIRGFDARFSAPAYPGDTVTTDMWQDRNVVSFQCSVASRDSVVVCNGKCTLAA
jgi:acyl dehydratase